MSRLTGQKCTADLDRTILRVGRGERVVLRQGRKAVAAVVSIEDLERLQQIDDESDIRDARASLREARRVGTISWERVKAELASRPPRVSGRLLPPMRPSSK